MISNGNTLFSKVECHNFLCSTCFEKAYMMQCEHNNQKTSQHSESAIKTVIS